jgi:uncharacterized RDD family membrane protein YckC
MAADQDQVSKVLSVLAHPLRRQILLTLNDKDECSFTDLLNKLKVDTGKLSFHLRALSAFLDQTSSGRYRLNRTGESAVRVISDVEFWAEGSDVAGAASRLPLASFSKRVAGFSFDFLITLGIALIVMFPQTISLVDGNVISESSGSILLVALFLLWIYSALLEGFIGQTLGKRIVGTKVILVEGKKATYEHTAIRNFGKAFLLPFDLLAGLRIKNAKFIRYFDKFTGTTVIDLRPRLG